VSVAALKGKHKPEGRHCRTQMQSGKRKAVISAKSSISSSTHTGIVRGLETKTGGEEKTKDTNQKRED